MHKSEKTRPTGFAVEASKFSLDASGGAATESESIWPQLCAGLGAAAWATIAVLAHLGTVPIGSVELIFLFAPLVIVPLGIELLRLIGATSPVVGIAQRLQPFCAALSVVAVCLPPGRLAGFLALSWICLCLLLAFSALADLLSSSSPWTESLRVILAIARVDLLVGGAWFLASRFGMRPLGTQEPIVLLTAVHFHFAGFATAIISAAMLHFAQRHGTDFWLKRLVPLVVGMPFVVAAGFVTSPALKMGAGVVFSASVGALALTLRSLARSSESRIARFFLYIAAASVFAGTVLSTVYAIADFRGSEVLPIPQMARTHGVLNAVGFCLPALLGWLIEYAPAQTELQFH